MLIFHLTTTDPAGAAYNLVRALNQYTPHRARLLSTHRIPIYNFPGDIDHIQDFGEELEALLVAADVLHFHKITDDFTIPLTSPLTGLKKEYRVADFMTVNGHKKKVVYHVHGHPYERERFKENAEDLAKRGQPVLCSTPDLEELYKPYCNAKWFPNTVPVRHPLYVPRGTNALIQDRSGERRVFVGHTPTDTYLKDTAIIKAVVEELAKTLPVYLHWTQEPVPQKIALTFKRVSHLVFDHMQGYYGLCSLEGLSMGKPTVAGLSDTTIKAICDFWGIKAETLPWVIARNFEQLKEAVTKLVTNQDWRESVGKESRAFMETLWSDENVAKRLADFYTTL